MIGTTSSSQVSNGALPPEERDAISAVAYEYMATFNIPCLSVAIGKDGEIVYGEGVMAMYPRPTRKLL